MLFIFLIALTISLEAQVRDLHPYLGCRVDENRYSYNIRNNCIWDYMLYERSRSSSWENFRVSTTSTLAPYKNILYFPNNVHDRDITTAWVEGAQGFGIGEKIYVSLHDEFPNIKKIIFVNGYIKSDKSWRDNSRVSVLLMYVHGKPYARLHLKDVKNEQVFILPSMLFTSKRGRNTASFSKNKVITFEILDVYPGDKYQDTAISELYFSG